MEITLFYTPMRNANEAETLGKKIVALKLAACANSFPVQSNYLWMNELQQDGEVILLLKTTISKAVELRKFIEENHSYEVPAILSWKVEVNDRYGRWMEETTS